MLTEGTENYTSRELAEEIERLGASIGASAGADSTVVAGSALSIYREELLRLLAEVVMRPVFPEDEFELYRQNTLEGLKFQRSQPSFLADEQFAKAIYGEHPYSIVSPTPKDIEGLTTDKLTAHHGRVFNPAQATVIAVGDFDNDEFLREIEMQFGSWAGSSEHAEISTPRAEVRARRMIVVDRPGSSQANILLGNPAIHRGHPDFFPVLVLNQILGAGASSRLFMNLRESKGYTYGAYSKFSARRFGGDFEASAEVRTEVVGESVGEFMQELQRIRQEPVPAGELADAINYLTGVFPLRAETQEGLMNLLVHQEVYGLPEDYLRTYRSHVAAVTAEDVRRVANAHIRPEEMTLVIVGDGEEIVRRTEGWCEEVTLLDTDGRPLGKSSPSDSMFFLGKWKLDVEFQGQNLKLDLTLESGETGLTGVLATPLGNATIAAGRVSGDSFSASASAEVNGQNLSLDLVFRKSGEGFEGSISSPMLPSTLVATGHRAE